MRYQSKRDLDVIAELDCINEDGSASMVYLTGPKADTAFEVSESTFKRWWTKMEDEKTLNETQNNNPSSVLNIDYDKVNEPYPEPKEQKYIPKPDSVVEYEEKKKRGRSRANKDLPSFTDIVNDLGKFAKKINETSGYLRFKDGTTLWRKITKIDIYAAEKTWEALTKVGLTSKPNNDKARPFGFEVKTNEEYEKAVSAISGLTYEDGEE